MSLFQTLITYLNARPPTNPPATTTDLPQRLHAACRSPTASITDPNIMRRELDIAKQDLARSKADSIRLDERCKMLEKALKDTRDLLRAREADLERMRRERDRERAMADRERRRSDVGPHPAPPSSAQQRYSSSLDTRLSAADIARGIQQSRPVSSGKPNPQWPTSADEHRAVARSAEVFTTRTDAWSGFQVLQAVHDINSHILQFAASATETFAFLPPPSNGTRPPQVMQAMADTSARLGPHMTRILLERDHSQDPLLVQLALQACAVLCIARALSAFCIGFPSKSDTVLSQIYAHIHLHEPQPTSAKWRSLTHQHIHAIYPTLTDYSITELSETILRWSADILLISNAIFPTGQTHRPPPSPSHSRSPSRSPTIGTRTPSTLNPSPNSSTPTLTSQYQSLLPPLRKSHQKHTTQISSALLHISLLTTQHILSTSFELALADPEGPFCPSEMEDKFAEYAGVNSAHAHAQNGEAGSGARVLGTLEIGLRCVTRRDGTRPGDLNGAGEGGEVEGATTTGEEEDRQVDGDGGVFEQRLLLVPKVVLESVLDVIDR